MLKFKALIGIPEPVILKWKRFPFLMNGGHSSNPDFFKSKE